MHHPCLVVGHPFKVGEEKGGGREVLTPECSLRSPWRRLFPLVLRIHPF